MNFLGSTKVLIAEGQLDTCPSSDTNAFREGYVTITPGSQNYTFSLDNKDIANLCCMLKGALTVGPSICPHKSCNTTSAILPPADQTAKREAASKATTDAFRAELEKQT